jgi:hypothetical protein
MESRIIETKLVAWRSIKIIQPNKFKEQTEAEKQKLIHSMLHNEIVSPLFVWMDEAQVIWCLDGRHRLAVMPELEEMGYNVPDVLPCVFIRCANKKEAAKMVLLYSSAYATATNMGFIEFLKQEDLELTLLKDGISIPGIDLAEVDFLMNPVEEELTRAAKDKPSTIKITFTDIKQMEKAKYDVDHLLAEKYPGAIYSISSGEV